jgi:Flp pilus assembly protein TadD
MDKRLYAVVAVGVFFSGAAHAADCSKLGTFEGKDLRYECERTQSIAEENRLRVKIACRQLKMAQDDLERLGGTTDAEDRAMAERDLKKCAQEFPSLGIVSSVPRFAPAPTPPKPSAYTRGLAALNEGNFDAAIAEFTAAIADDPKDTFSYIRRGTAYERKGDAASAVGDYRKVLKLVDADTGAEYAAKIRKLEKTKK